MRPVTHLVTSTCLLMVLAALDSAHFQKAKSGRVITAKQANAIALKRYPGRIVGKTRLENEDGTWQYGVLVRSGKALREIMINAGSGHIDAVETTNDKKERLEALEDAKKHRSARAATGKIDKKPKKEDGAGR